MVDFHKTTLQTQTIAKLNAIEASADVTDSTNVVAALTAGTNITISAGGTIASTDTNTTYSVGDGGLSQKNFTTTLKTKLDGIATGATNTAAPHYTSAIAVGAGGLTQQNFTTTLKNKLDGIAASANNYVLPSGYATESYVGTQISNLVDSSPAALNTLNELAAALGDDASFSTTVTNSIATKLPLAGGTLTGNLTAPTLYLNNTNTRLHEGSGDSLRISTSTGYIDIGSMNSGWIHFQGNKPYYFNQPMHIDNHLYPYSTAGARNIGGTGNIWNHVYAKGYFIDSTEVIDASRNLTNIGTISSGVITATGGNSGNWNTAYGWGNHASAGYTNDQTAAEILAALKTVDVNGTAGVNAGTVDGIASSRIIYGANASGTGEGTFSDWNAVTKSGFYSHSGASNKWSTANWSSILHTKLYNSNNSYATQLGFDTYNNNLYTRTNNNGTWTSWAEIWHAGVDGSGSGLDADLLDGQQGSYYSNYDNLSNKPNLTGFATFSGSNSFTNSYNEFGNNTGAVSNDGSWNARVNISGTSHARLDLFEDADNSKLQLYVHTGSGAVVGTTSSTALILRTAGTTRMTIPSNSGLVTTTGQGTLWGSSRRCRLRIRCRFT